MGDNRDNSADSRFSHRAERARAARCRGRISAAVPSSSPSRWTAAPAGNPLSWPASFRSGRAGTSLHPTAGSQMSADPPQRAKASSVVHEPGPNELRDPVRARRTEARARSGSGWRSRVALVVLLIQPLLIIFGGLVVASMLDGGARLLGRVLPIPRGLRLLIVVLLVLAFIAGVFYLDRRPDRRCRPSSCAPRCEVRATASSNGSRASGLMPGARRPHRHRRNRRSARSGGSPRRWGR